MGENYTVLLNKVQDIYKKSLMNLHLLKFHVILVHTEDGTHLCKCKLQPIDHYKNISFKNKFIGITGIFDLNKN